MIFIIEETEKIAEKVETKFKTSNYELDKPFRKRKKKKIIELMKNELGGKIMTKFVVLRAKTHSYLIDGSIEDKTAKETKKCDKRKIKFEIKLNLNCAEATQLHNKTSHLETNKVDIDIFFYYKRKNKKSMKSNKLTLKRLQRFKN